MEGLQKILDIIYLDGEHRAVLGSYALWRALDNPSWKPNNCDVYLKCASVVVFRTIIKELIIKLKQMGYNPKLEDDKFDVIEYSFSSIDIPVCFLLTKTTLNRTLLTFDLTCCMFKYYKNSSEALFPEIENLTLLNVAYTSKALSDEFRDLYRSRGFTIIERPSDTAVPLFSLPITSEE